MDGRGRAKQEARAEKTYGTSFRELSAHRDEKITVYFLCSLWLKEYCKDCFLNPYATEVSEHTE